MSAFLRQQNVSPAHQVSGNAPELHQHPTILSQVGHLFQVWVAFWLAEFVWPGRLISLPRLLLTTLVRCVWTKLPPVGFSRNP